MTGLASPRRAKASDAGKILAIYAPIVERTAISFEMQAPSESEMSSRIESALQTHEWLVMDADQGLAGYAYATTHRSRAAYRYSVDVSAYVHENHRGRGIGKRLYSDLMIALRQKGYHTAFATVALPNPASVELHRAAGFTQVGVFKEVGYKFGAWHDISWWQKLL